MALGIIEQLVHSTVRIETRLHDGGVSTGTGFYMRLCEDGDTYIPVIITNKHVVENADIGKFHVTFANDDGLPDIGNHMEFQISDFENQFIRHPDPNVDLAAFPIAPLIHKVNASGKNLFYIGLDTSLIPKDEEAKTFSSMEDVLMIGYPNGIWDEKNNLPVIRKGITATHSNISWNGKSEFLTDIANFNGSSGSPVFLANMNGYTNNEGNTFLGSPRIRLLGINYAGTLHTTAGEIMTIAVPTSDRQIPIVQIPNNIGLAINSKEIFILEKEVKKALLNK